MSAVSTLARSPIVLDERDWLDRRERATTTPAPGGSSDGARPRPGLLDAWRRRRRIAAGIAELRELDDRMLRDLGIDRGAIERAARTGRA